MSMLTLYAPRSIFEIFTSLVIDFHSVFLCWCNERDFIVQKTDEVLGRQVISFFWVSQENKGPSYRLPFLHAKAIVLDKFRLVWVISIHSMPPSSRWLYKITQLWNHGTSGVGTFTHWIMEIGSIFKAHLDILVHNCSIPRCYFCGSGITILLAYLLH